MVVLRNGYAKTGAAGWEAVAVPTDKKGRDQEPDRGQGPRRAGFGWGGASRSGPLCWAIFRPSQGKKRRRSLSLLLFSFMIERVLGANGYKKRQAEQSACRRF